MTCSVLDILWRARRHDPLRPERPPCRDGETHEVRAKIRQMVVLSDVVEASDEDIAWLYKGRLSETLRSCPLLEPSLRSCEARRQGRSDRAD